MNFALIKPIRLFHHRAQEHTPDQLEYWRTKLLPHYLVTDAIRQIKLPAQQDRYISRCHFEEKSSGGYRLVVDLRNVNKHFEQKGLKYETLALLKYAPQNVTMGSSIDM